MASWLSSWLDQLLKASSFFWRVLMCLNLAHVFFIFYVLQKFPEYENSVVAHGTKKNRHICALTVLQWDHLCKNCTSTCLHDDQPAEWICSRFAHTEMGFVTHSWIDKRQSFWCNLKGWCSVVRAHLKHHLIHVHTCTVVVLYNNKVQVFFTRKVQLRQANGLNRYSFVCWYEIHWQLEFDHQIGLAI